MVASDATLPNLGSAILAEQTRLQIPSKIDWIAPTIEFLRQRLIQVGTCDEMQADRLMLGLHEGLTNSIVHGNLEVSSALKERGDEFGRQLAERLADPRYAARWVTVVYEYDGTHYRWQLSDEGPGFDFAKVLHRLDDDPENGFLASGRGILMMRAFFNEVGWEEGGRCLRLCWTAPEEKRRHPRRPMSRKVQVAPIAADGTVDWSAANEGITRDVSTGGSLVLHQSLSQAERVMLAFDLNGESVSIPAQVRRWLPMADGLVEMGVCFQMTTQEPAPAAEQRVGVAIDRLLGHLKKAQGSGHERREHARVAYSERIEILGPQEQPTPGFAQDLSHGGIKFITARELIPGMLTLVLPLGETRLRVKAQVLRCVRVTEHFYDIAARFVDAE